MNVDDHSEEGNWLKIHCKTKNRFSPLARTVDSLLSLLEDLDKFEYGKAGLHGSVEELYGKIFTENSRESVRRCTLRPTRACNCLIAVV